MRLLSSHCHYHYFTLLVDDDQVQEMFYEMGQIPEVPVSVDLSTNVDTTSRLEAGGTLAWLVLSQ